MAPRGATCIREREAPSNGNNHSSSKLHPLTYASTPPLIIQVPVTLSRYHIILPQIHENVLPLRHHRLQGLPGSPADAPGSTTTTGPPHPQHLIQTVQGHSDDGGTSGSAQQGRDGGSRGGDGSAVGCHRDSKVDEAGRGEQHDGGQGQERSQGLPGKEERATCLKISGWNQIEKLPIEFLIAVKSLLIPDGGDNSPRELNDTDGTTLLSSDNLAGLQVTLPDDNSPVVLVTDGNEIACLVEGEMARGPAT